MPARIDYGKVAPEALRAVYRLEHYARTSGLEHGLVELMKLRASYMNGCAYCVDMHSKDALAAGETSQRLLAVPVWRETPFFTSRERAALAWTEAMTVPGHGISDEVFAEVRSQFSEEEIVKLSMVVLAINCWNRLAIGLGADVGSYQPKQAAAV